MTKDHDSDSLLEAFDKRAIAQRNLRRLDPKPDELTALNKSHKDKGGPSEEDEADKPPFKPRKSLNNPILAAWRGKGGLDLKLDDVPDRPGAAFVTGYGANGRYPRRYASFPAVPPAAGRLPPRHPVA